MWKNQNLLFFIFHVAHSEEMVNSSVIFLNMYCDCITMLVVCVVHASQELFKHSKSINLFSQIPKNLHEPSVSISRVLSEELTKNCENSGWIRGPGSSLLVSVIIANRSAVGMWPSPCSRLSCRCKDEGAVRRRLNVDESVLPAHIFLLTPPLIRKCQSFVPI